MLDAIYNPFSLQARPTIYQVVKEMIDKMGYEVRLLEIVYSSCVWLQISQIVPLIHLFIPSIIVFDFGSR